MTRMRHGWVLTAVLAMSAALAASADQSFGAGVTLAASTSIDKLYETPDAFVGKTVRVDGVVTAVCEEMGCWVALGSTKDSERVVRFKVEHEGEIVVVQNRWDGVPGECTRPSDEELQSVLNSVLQGKEDVIRAGGRDDMMGKSVRQLRDEKKRLLVFRNARQASNYDDDANATLDGESMVEKGLAGVR